MTVVTISLEASLGQNDCNLKLPKYQIELLKYLLAQHASQRQSSRNLPTAAKPRTVSPEKLDQPPFHPSMGALESTEEIDDIADQVAEAFGAPRQARETNSKMENLKLLSEWIETGQAKKIIVLTGAGISTGE